MNKIKLFLAWKIPTQRTRSHKECSTDALKKKPIKRRQPKEMWKREGKRTHSKLHPATKALRGSRKWLMVDPSVAVYVVAEVITEDINHPSLFF